jgi:hypothetical protein
LDDYWRSNWVKVVDYSTSWSARNKYSAIYGLGTGPMDTGRGTYEGIIKKPHLVRWGF